MTGRHRIRHLEACSHAVDSAVDNGGRLVDLSCGPRGVHRLVTASEPSVRLSSTATSPLGASVYRKYRSSSPVSTDAKTTDDNLNSMMLNDKSYSLVESGDLQACSSGTDEKAVGRQR